MADPILAFSQMTNTVYVTRGYKIAQNGRGVTVTGKKYDVTKQFHFIAAQLGYTLDTKAGE